MLGFLLMTLLFVGILVGTSKAMDFQAVKNNWPAYRCRPDIMVFADLFGHSATENIQFCLKNGFDAQAKELVGPFYTYMQMFVNTLMTLLSGLNSIRMIFSTIVGTISKTFSEFSDRFKQLFFRIQMTAIRMKFLMGRIFATVYAMMFMGMSSIQAVSNFGNGFLFKFLDTFCFDPDTPVELLRGTVPISKVRIGDCFAKDGGRVTAVFRFAADGQRMVHLGDVLVSTNHNVRCPTTGAWIHAEDHPDARVAPDWAGGTTRPLICLNTDTHTFPVGGYNFCDYDETPEGDKAAMKWATDALNGLSKGSANGLAKGSANGLAKGSTAARKYDTAVGAETPILTFTGSPIIASSIRLGDRLTHGTVAGIVKKEVADWYVVKGTRLAEAQLVWSETQQKWRRAVDVGRHEEGLEVFYSFVVTPSASFETEGGLMLRDYVEIHSPDAEAPYTQALKDHPKQYA